jgi:DNA polymerase-3 subunit gamma/tau
MFATTEAHKIPPTILSRCQRFDFRRVSLLEIISHLERMAQAEGVEVDRDTLTLIARESQGSLRDSQSLLDQVISYAGNRIDLKAVQEVLGVLDRAWLYRTTGALLRRDAGECLEVLSQLFHRGYSLPHFYYELVEHVRNLMVAMLGAAAEPLLHLPDHEIAQLREQVEELPSEDLHLWFDMLAGAEEDVRRSSYPRYLMEMLLVKMATLERTRDLAEIVDRIRSLRDGLGSLDGPEGSPASANPVVDRQAVPSGPVPEVSEQGWTGFLQHLRTHRPGMASILEQGRFLGCSDGDRIRVAFPTNFHVDRVSEREQTLALESLCREFFGRAVRVLPVLDAQGGVCRENHARQKQHQMQVGVKSHPLVQEALQVFGGQIVEIRPAGTDESSTPGK